MRKISLLLTVLGFLFARQLQAQIPENWTREKLIKMYGFRGVAIEYGTNRSISSISFIKQNPHNFHGGECMALILMVLRGSDDYKFDQSDVTFASGAGDSSTWIDRKTNNKISSGEGADFFHFTATNNGRLLLTAWMIGADKSSSEFVLRAQ
jgi:hypothetical protein